MGRMWYISVHLIPNYDRSFFQRLCSILYCWIKNAQFVATDGKIIADSTVKLQLYVVGGFGKIPK